jgi:glycyl-tRNA synthetase beta chain
MIETAATNFPDDVLAGKAIPSLLNFILERLRAYYLDAGFDVQNFDAVMSRQPTRPLDFDQRMHAVKAFRELPEADSLAAANKRIRNILRKAHEAGINTTTEYDADLLKEQAERDLATALENLQAQVRPLFAEREYKQALRTLAALQAPVDTFFEKVMVMCDEMALRNNRLALLNALSELFLEVADISLLQG